jgi:hypothetical protein
MHRRSVPQDKGLLGRWREINYAVDESGHYVKEPSSGWEPKKVANAVNWEPLLEAIDCARREVLAGRKSPLAFHMARFQMDAGLLAKNVGMAGWRVRRHLRPEVFAKLPPSTLKIYADLFNLTPEQLCELPSCSSLPDPD